MILLSCMAGRCDIDEAGAFHTERPQESTRHGFADEGDAAARWLRAHDPSLRASAAAKARHAKSPRVNAAGGMG